MPEPHALALFVGASLVLLVVPGPAVLYIVARSLDQGRAAGRSVTTLVRDSEVSATTGGQRSKAPPVGATAKLAADRFPPTPDSVPFPKRDDADANRPPATVESVRRVSRLRADAGGVREKTREGGCGGGGDLV